MKVAVIASGTMNNLEKMKAIIDSEFDYIICADGGAQYAYQMKLMPDMIVGDFDSISQDVRHYFERNIELYSFPKEKDDTDTQLAIDIALDKGADYIGLFGCTGSRLDHTLSNIFNLFYIRENNVKGIIIDDNNELFLAESETVISGEKGDLVSLISLSEKTLDITLKGFKYPLNKATLIRKHSLGISNELKDKKAFIWKGEGDLLVVRSND